MPLRFFNDSNTDIANSLPTAPEIERPSGADFSVPLNSSNNPSQGNFLEKQGPVSTNHETEEHIPFPKAINQLDCIPDEVEEVDEWVQAIAIHPEKWNVRIKPHATYGASKVYLKELNKMYVRCGCMSFAAFLREKLRRPDTQAGNAHYAIRYELWIIFGVLGAIALLLIIF